MSYYSRATCVAALFLFFNATLSIAGSIRCETFLRDRIPISASVADLRETLASPVLTRLALNDSFKWERAAAALGRELSEAEKIAMVAVYDSAIGQLGKNGERAAGEYYEEMGYTKKQLRTKRELLAEGGFSEAEIAKLFENPLTIGPNYVQNDQIRYAVRKLKARAKQGLERLENALQDDARLRRLPRWKGKGELQHLPALQRINELFGKNRAQELYDHVQALELEVMVRVIETRQPAEKCFEDVLTRWEQAHGFAAARELEPRVYTAKEFRAFMREGSLPQDPGLRDPFHLGAGFDRNEFAQHGYDTHRVQWNVVMRDMRLHPEYYESLGEPALASRLYVFMGQEEVFKKTDWRGTGYPGYMTATSIKSAFPGSRTLWDGLFEGDGYQHDFHSPLFVRKLFNDETIMVWPGLFNVFQ